MQTFKIELAGKIVKIDPLFSYIKEYCRDYLTDKEEDLSIKVFPSDIAFEKEKFRQAEMGERVSDRQFSDAYLETLAVYRKIAEQLLDQNILLFHGSAVAVDGAAYLFTARSGTGKSTHVRLWREHFGKRAVMINDDKPLLHITTTGVTAYGTPWDGKHRLNHNIGMPLKAICVLARDEKNHIEPIAGNDVWPVLLQQSYRSAETVKMKKVMELVDGLIRQVDFYSLGCNMEPEAARISWEGMNKEE